jgi:hypothetical protein
MYKTVIDGITYGWYPDGAYKWYGLYGTETRSWEKISFFDPMYSLLKA